MMLASRLRCHDFWMKIYSSAL